MAKTIAPLLRSQKINVLPVDKRTPTSFYRNPVASP